MEKLGTEAPHVQVIPEQMHDELAHERLQDAEIDFAIGMIVGKRTDWRRLNLFDDRFVLIARRDHPLAKRKATAAIMAAQRHVRIPILDWLDLLLASRGIRRDYAVTSANILAVPFIVARSDLIAIVPNSVAVRFMDFCHLREIEPPIELPTYVIDLVYHVRYEINPAHRWMKDTIVTIAAHMRRDPGRFPRSRSHTGR
jgi:DNA-binding transcriptional LysR family regulator